MTERDDINTSKIAIIGFLGSLVLFALLLLLLVVYYQAMAGQFRTKDLNQPNLELEALRVTQEQKLSQYAWVDRQKEVVAVPIDRAMDLTLRDIAAGKRLPPPRDIAPPAPARGASKEEKHGK